MTENPCIHCGRDVTEVNGHFWVGTPEGLLCVDCFLKIDACEPSPEGEKVDEPCHS